MVSSVSPGMKPTAKSNGIQLCNFVRRFLNPYLTSKSQEDSVKSALNAALGGVWHEVRANSIFDVGEMCVRYGEAVEHLEHIVHHCPAWAVEMREVALPASTLEAPPCVGLHGLLP
eukprot:1739345-Amphidinium_carterae.3